MKTSDILKHIEYKITGGSYYNMKATPELLKKYKLQNESRLIEYQDDTNGFSNRTYDGNILINGEKVLRITLRFPVSKEHEGYFRWTDPKYRKFFNELNKQNNDSDEYAYDSVKYTEIYLLEEILIKIQDMIKYGTCSYDVSYPLEIEEDFLKVAQTSAENAGIKVEDLLAQYINSEQDNFKKPKR